MARQRSSRPAPRRPAARPAPASVPARAAPAPVPAVPQSAPVQGQAPGLFAQMATTAAGVAVGHAAGHAMVSGASSLFGGSGESEPAPAPQAQPQQTMPQQYSSYQPSYQNDPNQASAACDVDQKSLLRCLEQSNYDRPACQYYIDMLARCREFSSTL